MKKRLVNAITIGLLVALLAVPQFALACTSIPVSAGASADGCVMTSHTDDSGSDTMHVTVVPAADWPEGSMRKVIRNTDFDPYGQLRNPHTVMGEIPQVPHTYAYFNSSYSFMNEKQVGIGETTVGGRRELTNPNGWFDVVDLQRVALERASTAREAIQIMGSLAEKYGYGIGGECLTVIDPKEAWMFEIWGGGALWSQGDPEPGAVWVAARIPDGEVGVSCNRSRIGAIDLNDPDHFMASPNVYTLAQEMGWWDPASGEEFKVYETYGYKAPSAYNSRREWRVLSLLAPSLNLDPEAERYPFSVKPDKPVTPQDIMRINRDHYEGTEYDLTVGLAAGPFGTPNRYPTASSANPQGSAGWERAISMFRAVYSTVLVAREWLPDAIGGLAWFGYDAPHSTCYIPLYCNVAYLPESFAKGMRGGSYDVFSRESAYWAFNFVSNFADLKYSYMIKDIEAVRDPLEAEFFALQPAVEKAALALYQTNPEAAKTFLTTYTNNQANRVVDAYWKLASQLAGRYCDGYVYGDDTYKMQTVGYPDWWLKAVDFGISTIPKQ
ncbi:MAG: Dipeptidase A [Firmicutes bacterium ADurb.Bin506]|jgi:dipeptidase|nr:MAG: Dipeptidase A [Firmicutes bacterium ADurb.Bin506]